MLKAMFKRAAPDRLGGFDVNEAEGWGFDLGSELGEELETFQATEFGECEIAGERSCHGDSDVKISHPMILVSSSWIGVDRTSAELKYESNAEADRFTCFVRLLSDSVDHFCQLLDNSSVGILSTLSHLMELLKANDEELWRHLEMSTKVNLQFYAFRWITLLLTQEFDFHSIMRIWDSLLSNPLGVQEMLLHICCAMLLCIKNKLLNGDFAANLKLLQHHPNIEIEYLLQVARELSPNS